MRSTAASSSAVPRSPPCPDNFIEFVPIYRSKFPMAIFFVLFQIGVGYGESDFLGLWYGKIDKPLAKFVVRLTFYLPLH